MERFGFVKTRERRTYAANRGSGIRCGVRQTLVYWTRVTPTSLVGRPSVVRGTAASRACRARDLRSWVVGRDRHIRLLASGRISQPEPTVDNPLACMCVHSTVYVWTSVKEERHVGQRDVNGIGEKRQGWRTSVCSNSSKHKVDMMVGVIQNYLFRSLAHEFI